MNNISIFSIRLFAVRADTPTYTYRSRLSFLTDEDTSWNVSVWSAEKELKVREGWDEDHICHRWREKELEAILVTPRNQTHLPCADVFVHNLQWVEYSRILSCVVTDTGYQIALVFHMGNQLVWHSNPLGVGIWFEWGVGAVSCGMGLS